MKKRVITLILLLLAAFICIGQNQTQTKQQKSFEGFQTHTDYEGKTYNWEQVNETCYNCASFYVKTMRTSIKDEYGYYYYYVFLYSNSYDKHGYLANTYFTGLNLYVTRANQGFVLVDTREYALVPPKSENYDGVYTAFIFNSVYASEKVKITWQDVTVY